MNWNKLSKMLISVGFVLCGGLLTACRTVCDDACDKLEDCGLVSIDNVRCSCDSEAEECVAECVLDASCEDITSNEPNEYNKCVIGCLFGSGRPSTTQGEQDLDHDVDYEEGCSN